MIPQIDNLLSKTETILAHQEEVEQLKGEKFNVFSILKLTHLEDRLHSHFIKELLDPEGSHLKKGLFLNLFLHILNKKWPDELQYKSDEFSKVHREFHIGAIDPLNKTGGRIDILIEGSSPKRFISIENKIYAGDQKNQIERYCNFEDKINDVYYLTLDGKEPHISSIGNLKSDEHFKLISFKTHIIDWLELCLKEVYDEPILRESIKQYLILIQKLTHTVSDKFEKEIDKLIINNLEAAKYVASAYKSSLQRIRENFRTTLMMELTKTLKEYKVYNARDVNARHSALWIKSTKNDDPILKFGLETFSGDGHYGGNLMLGTYKRRKLDELKDPDHFSDWWIELKDLEYKNHYLNLGKQSTLLLIQDSNSDDFRKVVNFVIQEVIEYIKSIEDQKVNEKLEAKLKDSKASNNSKA